MHAERRLPLAAPLCGLPTELPKACLDGSGPDGQALTLDDFVPVDDTAETWTEADSVGTGKPMGRAREPATGYPALEAAGAPIEFRNLRRRELPRTWISRCRQP